LKAKEAGSTPFFLRSAPCALGATRFRACRDLIAACNFCALLLLAGNQTPDDLTAAGSALANPALLLETKTPSRNSFEPVYPLPNIVCPSEAALDPSRQLKTDGRLQPVPSLS
jgi:hypothetical protein